RLKTADPAPDQIDHNILSWQIDSLGVDEQRTIQLIATVADTLPKAYVSLINIGVVISRYDTSDTGNGDDHEVIAIDPRYFDVKYDLNLMKISDTDTSTIGKKFYYTLTVENLGPNTAYHVVLIDTLPDILEASDFTIEPDTVISNILIWNFITIKVGQRIEISFSATVVGELPETPYRLKNTGHVIAPQDTNLISNDDDAITIVIDDPKDRKNYDLVLTKSADRDTVQAGETLIYSITVRNNGPANAFDVTIVDSLPPYVTASDFSIPPTNIEEHVVTWKIPVIMEDQDIIISFTATLSDSLPLGALSILNVAAIIAPNDTTTSGDSPEAELIAIDPRFNQKLTDASLTMTVSQDTVMMGEDVTIGITVINLGPDMASHVTVTDTLHELMEASNFNIDPIALHSNIYQWTFTNVDVGEQIVIDYHVRTDEANLTGESITLMTRARVETENDGNLSNNEDAVDVTFVNQTENCDLYYFDVNVFEPETGIPLGIHFSLNSSRAAKLDLYDVTGYHIGTLVDDGFNIGGNVYCWDGNLRDGKRVGSGVYIIALRTGKLICWKKVIIIR
ncbi:DUF11 domain-containing protein, partial [candidate division KSB1 bacterium]|nr:DUF11 domain-containing protein [candidate division KSB1 bacterium]